MRTACIHSGKAMTGSGAAAGAVWQACQMRPAKSACGRADLRKAWLKP